MAENRKIVTISETPARFRIRAFDAKGNVLEERWCAFADTAMAEAEELNRKHKLTEPPRTVKFGQDL